MATRRWKAAAMLLGVPVGLLSSLILIGGSGSYLFGSLPGNRRLQEETTMIVFMELQVSLLSSETPSDGAFEDFLCHLGAYYTEQITNGSFQAKYSQWSFDSTASVASISMEATAILPNSFTVLDIEAGMLLPELEALNMQDITSGVQETLPEDHVFQDASITTVTHNLQVGSTDGNAYFDTANCGVAAISMQYGFFTDIPIEDQEPTEVEVQNLMCVTGSYFTSLFTGQNQLENGKRQLDVTIDRVHWTFDPEANLTTIVTFDMQARMADDTERRVAPQDLLHWMEFSDLTKYVEYAVWEAVPVKENTFYNVNRVHFRGRERPLDDKDTPRPEQTFSTKFCMNGVIPEELADVEDDPQVVEVGEESSLSPTVAPVIQTASPTSSVLLEDVASYNMDFGFTAGTTQREPTQEEINQVICQTAYYFTDIFLSAHMQVTPMVQRLFPISEFLIQSHSWVYNATAELPVRIRLDAKAWYQRGNLVAANVVLNKMKSMVITDYITKYIWNVPEDNLFYHTETVHYTGKVEQREVDVTSSGDTTPPSGSMSSSSCPRFITEPPSPTIPSENGGSETGTIDPEVTDTTSITNSPAPITIIFPGWNSNESDKERIESSNVANSTPSPGSQPNTFNGTFPGSQNDTVTFNGTHVDGQSSAPTPIPIQTVYDEVAASFQQFLSGNYTTDPVAANSDTPHVVINASFIVASPSGSNMSNAQQYIETAFSHFVNNLARNITNSSFEEELEEDVDIIGERLLQETLQAVQLVDGSAEVDSLTEVDCLQYVEEDEAGTTGVKSDMLILTKDMSCYNVLAHYQMMGIDDEDWDKVTAQYEELTYTGIQGGLLQDSLNLASPDSGLYINPNIRIIENEATLENTDNNVTDNEAPNSVEPGNDSLSEVEDSAKGRRLSGGLIFLIFLLCLVCCIRFIAGILGIYGWNQLYGPGTLPFLDQHYDEKVQNEEREENVKPDSDTSDSEECDDKEEKEDDLDSDTTSEGKCLMVGTSTSTDDVV